MKPRSAASPSKRRCCGKPRLPDRTGFICACHFGADGVPVPVAESVVEAAVRISEGWLWLHLNLGDQRCLRRVLVNAGWTVANFPAGLAPVIAGGLAVPPERGTEIGCLTSPPLIGINAGCPPAV